MFREQCVKFAEMDIREQLYEAFLSARSEKLWVNRSSGIDASQQIYGTLFESALLLQFASSVPEKWRFQLFFFKSSTEQITFEVTQW